MSKHPGHDETGGNAVIEELLKKRSVLQAQVQQLGDRIREAALLDLAKRTGIMVCGVVTDGRSVYQVTRIEVYTDNASIGAVYGRKRTKSGWHSKVHWIAYGVDRLKAVKE